MVKSFERLELFLQFMLLPLVLMVGIRNLLDISLLNDLNSAYSARNSNTVTCNGLDILYTNADQFSNKRDDLCMAISGSEPDIILISEILPKAHSHTLTKAGLSLPGYTIFTNFDLDLLTDGIRGVAIFVLHKLSATEVNFDKNDFKDHLWIKIHLNGTDVLLIGCIYRSPSGDIVNSTTSVCDLLRSISGYSHLLIVW